MFLAKHKNRESCGKCGYTEFKGGVPKVNKQENKIESSKEDLNQDKK